MAIPGKKVISLAQVLFQAAWHALTWFGGLAQYASSLWQFIETVGGWIRSVYRTLSDFWKQFREEVWAKVSPIGDIVHVTVMPSLNWIESWVRSFETAYKSFRDTIVGKVEKLTDSIFGPVISFARDVDRTLLSIQQVVGVFSEKAAEGILKVRQNIQSEIIERVMDIQSEIVSWVSEIFLPADRFTEGIKALMREHIDPLKRGLGLIEENLRTLGVDVGKKVGPEASFRVPFAWNPSSKWGRQLFREYFRCWEPKVLIGDIQVWEPPQIPDWLKDEIKAIKEWKEGDAKEVAEGIESAIGELKAW